LLSGFYQVVAALTVFVSYSTWNRKNITIIIVGHISGDQRTSICRLNDNRCLTHSSHDAVSTYKIFFIGFEVLQNSVIKPPFSSTLATYFYAFWDKFGLNHALPLSFASYGPSPSGAQRYRHHKPLTITGSKGAKSSINFRQNSVP
jgi:hypothetical protein